MSKTVLVCLSFVLFGFLSILSAIPVQASVQLAPTSLSFPPVAVNTSSGSVAVLITNASRQSVIIEGIASSLPEFIVSGITLPLSLSPHSTTSFHVVFRPVAAVRYSGRIQIMFGGHNMETVFVTGSGIAAAAPANILLSDSTNNLSFGSTLVGTSASQSISFTNTGVGSVTISQVSVSNAAFAVSGFSGAVTLAAGQSLALTVSFTPSMTGSVTGNLAVTSSAPNSPATIALSGTGVQPQISVSPASASFGSVNTGATGTQTLTISNPGTGNLTVSQASLSGTGFAVSGLSMPVTIPPGGSSPFKVSFTPASAGTFAGMVTLTNNSPTSSIGVSLSGTGVAQVLQLTASPASLGFGNVAMGTSATETVTLTNTGNSSVSLSQESVTGSGFSVTGLSLPLTLGAGQSTSFTVAFAPTTAGNVTGSVAITSNATNSPATIALSGTGTQAQISVSPASLSFGSVNTGATGTQTLTISNPGTANLTVTQASLSVTGFSYSGLTLPLTVAPGSSSTFTVSFAPTSAGSFSGTLTLANNSPTSSLGVSLSGTGVAQTFQLTASPTSLTFGNVATGTSATQTVTVSNSGSGSISLSSDSVAGSGFSVTGLALPLTLAAGQSTSFTVAFAPTAAGSVTGSITINSNATNSPATIALSGTGIQPLISISPASVSFGSVNTGATGTQTLTISNPGTANLTVTQASLSGSAFAFSGLTVPLTIAPGGSSTFMVGFAPTAAGSFSGTLTLANNSPTSSLSVSLSGTGVASVLQLSASPVSLSFGNVLTGSSSTQTVTLNNTGNASLSLSGDSVTGSGFSINGLTLPLTLAAGQSTSFTVAFAPTAAGSVTGSATVISNATNSPATIALSGTGIQPLISLSPASASFGSVTAGVTNTQTLTISNPGTANLTVTQASLSGTGFTYSGLTLPLTVAPGSSSTFTVSFAPTAAGSFSGTLTLTNNSPTPSVGVSLSGTGVAQVLQLTASPTSLSFGNVNTSSSATQTVTLSNTGNTNVSLSQDSVTGSGFSITGLALPLTLAAGQSTSFSVVFAPSATGSVSGTVTVTSNATNSPATISLSGTGTSSTTYTVTLTWTASSSTYSGFNVYRSTVSGGPYTEINTSLVSSPTYTDSNVTAGQTYYYVVTEVNTAGVESAYSTQTSATIP